MEILLAVEIYLLYNVVGAMLYGDFTCCRDLFVGYSLFISYLQLYDVVGAMLYGDFTCCRDLLVGYSLFISYLQL